MNTLKRIFLAVAGLFVLTHTLQAHYDPNIGRWISRDSIAENGGANLYGFVENDGVDYFDDLGQMRNHAWASTSSPSLAYKSEKIDVKECGYFEWRIDWYVSPKAGKNGGVILQEIKMEGRNLDNGDPMDLYNYHEGWRVYPNSTKVGSYTRPTTGPDIEFTDPDNPGAPRKPADQTRQFFETRLDRWFHAAKDGISGEFTQQGWARYRIPVSEKEMLSELPGNVAVAGGLPSRNVSDGLPSFPNSQQSSLVYRKIKVSWCCKPGASPEDRKTKVEISPTTDTMYLPKGY